MTAIKGGLPTMVRYRIGLLALVAVCAPLAWALPAAAHQSTVRAATITVTAGKPAEFRFTLSKKTAPLGTVTFKVTVKGALPHDFKIAGHKTKLLSPGQSQTLKVTFKKKGSYPYLCTVTGHAAAGMKGIFKIT
jgi:uncharacterized cupredoxin-like copper-binding protein